MSKLRPHLSYANVMATIAVMIAMGGTAYAAATITGADVVDESLTGADIQNKSVAGADLACCSVGSPKVVDESLGAIDLAPNSVGASEAIDNSLGAIDIANNSITGEDIKGHPAGPREPAEDGSLTGDDIKNDALTDDDIKNDALTGADIDESSLQGVKISGLDIVFGESAFDSTSVKTASAICPPGTKAIGTGFDLYEADNTNSHPDPTINQVHNAGTGVYVVAVESQATSVSWSVQAEATCAKVE